MCNYNAIIRVDLTFIFSTPIKLISSIGGKQKQKKYISVGFDLSIKNADANEKFRLS